MISNEIDFKMGDYVIVFNNTIGIITDFAGIRNTLYRISGLDNNYIGWFKKDELKLANHLSTYI